MRRVFAIGVMVCAGVASEAAAQSDPPEFANPGGPSVVIQGEGALLVNPVVPVGGVVIVEVTDGTQPVVQVAQVEGNATMTYGGSLRPLTAQYWVWAAEPALAAGDYQVTVASSYGTQRVFDVMVVDDVSLEPPDIALAPEPQWMSSEFRSYFCEAWTGSQLIIQGSFSAAYAGQVIIAAGVSSDAPRAQIDQYLYRLTTLDGDLPRYSPLDRLPEVGPYMSEAEEYCFGLELLSAATGEAMPVEALTPTCVPHGDLPSLALDEIDVPDSALSRFICEKPPQGFEARWCALNAACDEVEHEDLVVEHCALYGHVCRGEGLPERGGASGSGGSAGDGGSTDEPGGSGSGGGCTVFDAPRARGSLMSFALLFLLWISVRAYRVR